MTMAYEYVGGEHGYVTMLYSSGASDFEAMRLSDAIAWLQSVASEQPCSPEEIVFKIDQSGDSWDGYSEAEVKIFRRETPEEEDARKAAWAADEEKRQRAQEAEDRRRYEALRAKYGE